MSAILERKGVQDEAMARPNAWSGFSSNGKLEKEILNEIKQKVFSF